MLHPILLRVIESFVVVMGFQPFFCRNHGAAFQIEFRQSVVQVYSHSVNGEIRRDHVT